MGEEKTLCVFAYTEFEFRELVKAPQHINKSERDG